MEFGRVVVGDLAAAGVVDRAGGELELGVGVNQHGAGVGQAVGVQDQRGDRNPAAVDNLDGAVEIGRASCRDSVRTGGAAHRFDIAVVGDVAAAGDVAVGQVLACAGRA